MATYTDNYQYTKPTMAESADIRVINSNFDKVDTIEHATQISLAPAYDPAEEYAAGAVVMFEFLMYQCDEDGATGTFDPAKWHRVTAADVGAGGTEVEANPAGTPTETLQTIGIAGTIYEIEGGGGGGGGGMTVLDNTIRTALNTSFELAESILNFDFLIILTRWTGGSGDPFTESFSMPVPQIEYNTGIYIDGGNNDRMSLITFTDATHYEIIAHNTATDAVAGVYGVKAGGSSRSDDLSEREWTLLAATTGTSSATAIPAGTEFLVLTAELGGIVSLIAKESIKNINKLLNVSQLSTWNQGYEYADTAGNHTTISMSVTAGAVTIKSGYSTVTAKVYAIS